MLLLVNPNCNSILLDNWSAYSILVNNCILGNPTNYINSRPAGLSYLLAPYQFYQSAFGYHTYHYMKIKKIYHIDNNIPLKKELIGPNANSSYYINKGYKEMLVYFVRIESTYRRCIASLQSFIELHKYIKANYIIVKSYDNLDVLATIPISFSMPIICLTT